MSEDRRYVIVTGSSGLLGRPVCRRLAELGYQVFGLDRVGLPEPPKDNPLVRDLECDVTDYNSVRGAIADMGQVMEGKRIASVVHMAAYYDFSGSDSPLYREVTVDGTDRLLNALGGFELEQFLFTSTMLVHRPCQVGETIHEGDPLEAKWPYPQSKIDTEELIRTGHPHTRSVFLRLGGIYTDFGQQPTLVQQIQRIHQRELQSHLFPGNPDAGQSCVHLDDAVEAIVATVERRASIPSKTAILIGEPAPPSYEELQDAIGQRLYGSEWSTIRIPEALAKAGAAITDVLQGGEAFIKPFMVEMADDHYAPDISRARELLGWTPKHRMLDDLDGIIDALKADPEQWRRANGLEVA